MAVNTGLQEVRVGRINGHRQQFASGQFQNCAMILQLKISLVRSRASNIPAARVLNRKVALVLGAGLKNKSVSSNGRTAELNAERHGARYAAVVLRRDENLPDIGIVGEDRRTFIYAIHNVRPDLAMGMKRKFGGLFC